MNSLVYIVGILLALASGWYLYQLGSRAKTTLFYKFKRTVVALVAYFVVAVFLTRTHGLEPVAAVALSVLAGLGAASLVKAPNRSRRIPKAIRRAVIERDLGSKGKEWERARHHVDHVMPFSRGGDHSMRNLRVVEKQANLRKGAKLPRVRDLLK